MIEDAAPGDVTDCFAPGTSLNTCLKRGTDALVREYFALDHPLEEIYASFPEDEAMRTATAFCQGLRILRQSRGDAQLRKSEPSGGVHGAHAGRGLDHPRVQPGDARLVQQAQATEAGTNPQATTMP